MPVLLLEVVDRFEVAVQVRPRIAPRVVGIVYLLVGPSVRENNFA